MRLAFLITLLFCAGLKAQDPFDPFWNVQTNAAAAPPPEFSYTSVVFDGTTGYLSRGADLTGVIDSGQFTLSVWLKNTDYSAQHFILANTLFGFPGLDFYWDGTGVTRLRAWDSGSSSLGDVGLPAVTTTAWVHWLISVDCGGTTRIYTNDVQYYSGADYSAGSIDLTQGDFFIGATGIGGSFFNGLMSEFWFVTGTAIDISNSTNRRKFISALLKPVNLGADGSTPTGSAPAIYLHNATPNFQNNLGGGGGLTLNGTITDGGSDKP